MSVEKSKTQEKGMKGGKYGKMALDEENSKGGKSSYCIEETPHCSDSNEKCGKDCKQRNVMYGFSSGRVQGFTKGFKKQCELVQKSICTNLSFF